LAARTYFFKDLGDVVRVEWNLPAYFRFEKHVPTGRSSAQPVPRRQVGDEVLLDRHDAFAAGLRVGYLDESVLEIDLLPG
jgi:hypothetical protein